MPTAKFDKQSCILLQRVTGQAFSWCGTKLVRKEQQQQQHRWKFGFGSHGFIFTAWLGAFPTPLLQQKNLLALLPCAVQCGIVGIHSAFPHKFWELASQQFKGEDSAHLLHSGETSPAELPQPWGPHHRKDLELLE